MFFFFFSPSLRVRVRVRIRVLTPPPSSSPRAAQSVDIKRLKESVRELHDAAIAATRKATDEKLAAAEALAVHAQVAQDMRAEYVVCRS